MDENKEVIIEETKPLETANEKVVFEPAKKTSHAGWGKKSVSRRFLIIALAVAVIINGALSAGVLALSKGPKAPKPDKITEDQNNSQSDNNGGNQFGDQYNNGYGNQYSDPYGGNNGSFGDQYNNGNGDQYSDPYGGNNGGYDDQYSNGNQSSKASIGIVITENSGVYVAQVTGSNAKKAGFEEGDKIVSIDGKSITNSSDLISEVQSHKSGDTVLIVVERNGQSIEIKTELE